MSVADLPQQAMGFGYNLLFIENKPAGDEGYA
jgi:hypothetical protein